MRVRIDEVFNNNYSMADTIRLLDRKKTEGLQFFGGKVELDGTVIFTPFELLRVLNFGHLDKECKPKTPLNRTPSYTAAVKFIKKLDCFEKLMLEQRFGKNREWAANLELSESGEIKRTVGNLLVIFKEDSKLQGLAFDQLLGKRIYLPGFLNRSDGGYWNDADESYLFEYLEREFNYTSRTAIADALNIVFRENSFNPVKQYLEGLSWDGQERLAKIFIDYLGAEDNTYTRVVTRRKMIATVARAMIPGCKHDECLILSSGEQGIGKNTMLGKLAKKDEWFNEELKKFDDKDTVLEIQRWIVVADELDTLRKSEATLLKSFMSRTVDKIREPYQRYVTEKPRTCSFFGTTNAVSDIISDPSGGRRFWIVGCNKNKPTKDVFTDLDKEVDQIWAEAMHYYQAGEQWHLTKEEEKLAREVQDLYKQELPWAGEITEYLDRRLPNEWDSYDKLKKLSYLRQHRNQEVYCEKIRRFVCAPEVFYECVNLDGTSKYDTLQAKEIAKILNYLPGWKRASGTKRFGEYGVQRYWERI